MKLFAKQSFVYDGRKISWGQSFDVDDYDGNLLIDARLACIDGGWVGEGIPRPITEHRDYFGEPAPFISAGLSTRFPVEIRMSLDEARRRFMTNKCTESATHYFRAACSAWAHHEIGRDERQAISAELEPYSPKVR